MHGGPYIPMATSSFRTEFMRWNHIPNSNWSQQGINETKSMLGGMQIVRPHRIKRTDKRESLWISRPNYLPYMGYCFFIISEKRKNLGIVGLNKVPGAIKPMKTERNIEST